MTIHVSGPLQWSAVTRALSDALLEELSSEGMHGTRIETNTEKPDVVVSLEAWEKGSRALR